MTKGITVTGRPLNHLAHPLTWLAAGVLLFNVYYLQPLAPSWISGKLGDLAWLVLAPLLAAALLDLLLPFRWNKAAGPVAFLLTGTFFCLLKLSPQVNLAVGQVYLALTGDPEN